jgi:hypothetical protein
MNICVNIFGQIKNIEYLKQTIETSILDNNNKFHILFTTWNDTDINQMKNIFPNCYIKQYNSPDLINYEHLICNYKLDITQISEKKMERYLLGFYIKSKCQETIIEYENNNNIKFDIIITIRTYTRLYNEAYLQQYYSILKENIIYTAEEPSFAIYSMPAYPDTFTMSKRDCGLDILNVFDVLEKCTINNTNIFHPETSAYQIVIKKNFSIIKLPFNAFLYP